MADSVQRLIDFTKSDIKSLQKNPIKNISLISHKKRLIKTIQSMSEGERDILNTRINNFASTGAGKEVDKNNFATYEAQVNACYDMYEARSTYGAEMLGGIIDTRVAFIAGEGLSVASKNPATREYIDNFIKQNKLNGSRLINMVTIGELEGCNLVTLKPYAPEGKKDKWHVKARSFAWHENKYRVEKYAADTDEIEKVVYKDKTNNEKEATIKGADCVYIKLGGVETKLDNPTNRIHRVLTNIENISRGIYDLRHNTHLFGRTTPYWETLNQLSAAAINAAIQDGNWSMGKGYAGSAKFSLVEPTGAAAEAALKDIMINTKIVSTSTGLPVHFLAWTELMSNRATADNLMELVKAATQKERLIWEEAFTELIQKSMQIAIDTGIATNAILNDFTVKLPFTSLALIKTIIEVWEPLRQANVISDFTLLNMLPGVDPEKEKEKVREEKEKRAKNDPLLNNMTVKNTLNQMQQNKKQMPGNKMKQEGAGNGDDED